MTVWTEDEAKTKVCPHLPADYDDSIVSEYERARRVTRFPLCIASGCMMWRKKDQIGIGPDGEKRDRDMDGRTRWVDRGYCGIAKIPEAQS